jgi:hypothetical protein
MANVQRRIEVTVDCVATAPTPKRLTVPLSGLDLTTRRAGDASVGWSDHLDSKAVYRREQQHSISEEASRMLLPANQPFGIFQGNASARPQCHGHRLSGFAGNLAS